MGAELSGDPPSMIEALRKLDRASRRVPNKAALMHPALAHLFIVDPLPRKRWGNIFASHPPLEKRIARLARTRKKTT
jgi:heat shock protein HtpX